MEANTSKLAKFGAKQVTKSKINKLKKETNWKFSALRRKKTTLTLKLRVNKTKFREKEQLKRVAINGLGKNRCSYSQKTWKGRILHEEEIEGLRKALSSKCAKIAVSKKCGEVHTTEEGIGQFGVWYWLGRIGRGCWGTNNRGRYRTLWSSVKNAE